MQGMWLALTITCIKWSGQGNYIQHCYLSKKKIIVFWLPMIYQYFSPCDALNPYVLYSISQILCTWSNLPRAVMRWEQQVCAWDRREWCATMWILREERRRKGTTSREVSKNRREEFSPYNICPFLFHLNSPEPWAVRGKPQRLCHSPSLSHAYTAGIFSPRSRLGGLENQNCRKEEKR